MEHMKELDMPVGDQVFHSLIYGHAKLGELSSADHVMAIMADAELAVDSMAHTAKLVGMIENGADFAQISQAITEVLDSGIMINDQNYFDLMEAFLKQGQKESARSLAEQLPRRAGYFATMRNNIPKMIELGDHQLALKLMKSFSVPINTSDPNYSSTNRGNGIFILRSMTANGYSVQEIYEALVDLNPDDQNIAIVKCYEDFLRYKMFDAFTEFVQILRAKDGKLGIFVGETINNALRYIFSQKSVDPEEAFEYLINLKKSGIYVSPTTISTQFLPHIFETDNTQLFRQAQNLIRSKEDSIGLGPSVIFAATFQFGMNKNSPDYFKEVAIMAHFCSGLRCMPLQWKNSLARNYLITKDMDSLKAVLCLQSNIGDQLLNHKKTEDDVVFMALPLIHAEAYKFHPDEDPEKILGQVLIELEKDKLGVPPKVALELSNLVESEDLKKTLQNLSENYEKITEIWSEDGFKQFLASNKASILDSRPQNNKSQRRPPIFAKDTIPGMNKYLEDHPDNFKVHHKLLIAYMKDDQVETAIEHARKLKLTYPKFNIPVEFISLLLKSRLKVHEGNDFDAIKECQKMIQELDENASVPIGDAMTVVVEAAKNGKENEALELLESLPCKINSNQLYSKLFAYIDDIGRLKASTDPGHARPLLQVMDDIIQDFIEQSNFEKADQLVQKINDHSNITNFNYSQRNIETAFATKYSVHQDFEKAAEETKATLKLDDSMTMNCGGLVLAAMQHLKKGEYDKVLEMLKMLEEENSSMDKSGIVVTLKNLVTEVVRDEKAPEEFVRQVVETTAKYDSNLEGYLIKYNLSKGDIEAALNAFETLTESTHRAHFLSDLVKELAVTEDRERMQRLLNAAVKVMKEEGAIYTFARIFLELGRFHQAKKLMSARGLRYNQTIVATICKLLENRYPTAHQEFVKLCIPLFGSDQNYLFERLVKSNEGNPEKMEEVWLLMQENNFIPSQKLWKLVNSSKNSSLMEEAGQGQKKSSLMEEAGQDQSKAISILLQEMSEKNCTISRIKEVLKEMKQAGNYEQLQDILLALKDSSKNFKQSVMNEIMEFPIDVLNSVNLTKDQKLKLHWNTAMVRKVAAEKPNLSKLFEDLDAEKIVFIPSDVLTTLLKKDAESVPFLVEKVQQYAQEKLFVNRAVLTLIDQGHDESARKVWPLIDQSSVNGQMKEKFSAFASKHQLES